MPVYQNFEIDNCRIIIWKSVEGESFILPSISELEANELNHLPPGRRLQGIVFRKMLQQLLPNMHTECVKDEYGKPYLTKASRFISFSHTSDYLVAISSDNVVGIDIQQYSQKIERVAHKFVADSERQFIDNQQKINYLHLLWSAKESLYKADGKRGLEFKTQLLIEPFEWQDSGGMCHGQVIRTNEIQHYKINYRLLDNMILVWAVLESSNIE